MNKLRLANPSPKHHPGASEARPLRNLRVLHLPAQPKELQIRGKTDNGPEERLFSYCEIISR